VSSAVPWTDIDWASYVHEVSVRGARVRYVDYGDGPPLLLIHGMGGRWETWLANISTLGEHYRVIAVDLPGFGRSEPLPAGADFGGYPRVLEDLLDDLGIASVAVFGHSLGGLVSLALAASAPERVRCVVLVSGGGAALSRLRLAVIQACFHVLKVLLGLPGTRRLLRRSAVSRTLIRPAVHYPADVPDELLRAMIPDTVTSGFMDGVRLGGSGLRELDLDAVTAPTLLVWGRKDRILPVATANELTSRLRAARLVVLDNVAHCAMFEAPREFHALAEEFLALQWTDRGTPPNHRASAWSWTGSSVMDVADGSGRCGDGAAG
jgi:pimeloyl-ACP methyl ester carboxylesterase